MGRSHLTAIVRKTPSLPVQVLKAKGLIKPTVLDYGCGRGFDAKYLKCDKYDPYYAPDEPQKKYRTILCTYVLNVVEEKEQWSILRKIRGMLIPNGVAYITVRRDMKSDYCTKNSVQRIVRLPYATAWRDPMYHIYALTPVDRITKP